VIEIKIIYNNNSIVSHCIGDMWGISQ